MEAIAAISKTKAKKGIKTLSEQILSGQMYKEEKEEEQKQAELEAQREMLGMTAAQAS